uniref:SS nuclear autoantigen 1 n=1 Tax=Rattus norvegicus TaxID=10116 RepID=A0A8I6ACI2_RAT
ASGAEGRGAGGRPTHTLGRLRRHASRAPLCGLPSVVLVGVRSSRAPTYSSVFPPTLGIEELCQKREELCRQIQQEEDEKQRLQNEVRQLTEKLARVNENLARKIASRNEFDRTIAETEAAYLKILESSQTLLSVLKREAGNLTKATASDQKSSGGKDS